MTISKLLATAALTATLAGGTAAQPAVKNVVLVHGAVMDGSSWRPVHDMLTRDGFAVSVVQLPLTGLDADVAAARKVIERQDGPVVLVGHSYGGAVISVAGSDPKVKALVYVAALQPDEGESVADLNSKWPMPGHPQMVDEASMIVDPAHFHEDIAADLPAEDAAFFAASQKPTATAVFTTKLPAVSWHDKPTFGIVSTADKTLSPEMKRFMYQRAGTDVTEVAASHLVQVSQPQAVVNVIRKAAINALR